MLQFMLAYNIIHDHVAHARGDLVWLARHISQWTIKIKSQWS